MSTQISPYPSTPKFCSTNGSSGSRLRVRRRPPRADRLGDVPEDDPGPDQRGESADQKGRLEGDDGQQAGQQRAQRDAETEAHGDDAHLPPFPAPPGEVGGQGEGRRGDARRGQPLEQPHPGQLRRRLRQAERRRRRHHEDQAGDDERLAADPVRQAAQGHLEQQAAHHQGREGDAEADGRLVEAVVELVLERRHHREVAGHQERGERRAQDAGVDQAPVEQRQPSARRRSAAGGRGRRLAHPELHEHDAEQNRPGAGIERGIEPVVHLQVAADQRPAAEAGHPQGRVHAHGGAAVFLLRGRGHQGHGGRHGERETDALQGTQQQQVGEAGGGDEPERAAAHDEQAELDERLAPLQTVGERPGDGLQHRIDQAVQRDQDPDEDRQRQGKPRGRQPRDVQRDDDEDDAVAERIGQPRD